MWSLAGSIINEKYKAKHNKAYKIIVWLVASNSWQPHGLPRLLCPSGFSRQEYWNVLACPPPRDLSNPGIKRRSPTLQAGSLPSEPPGKCKNTGVGSLSLLQGIFPTQESNQGLLHCRQILYQLSYQGSPYKSIKQPNKANANKLIITNMRIDSFLKRV